MNFEGLYFIVMETVVGVVEASWTRLKLDALSIYKILYSSLQHTLKNFLDFIRKIHKNEARSWIQIVFAFVVDDTDKIRLFG